MKRTPTQLRDDALALLHEKGVQVWHAHFNFGVLSLYHPTEAARDAAVDALTNDRYVVKPMKAKTFAGHGLFIYRKED